jgi:UDP-N-acetylmuramate dehydrogenase
VSPLQHLHTFQLPAFCQSVKSLNDLAQAKQFAKELSTEPFLLLGGGSNCAFIEDFEGHIVRVELKGIQVEEREDGFSLTVGAGENWHQFVLWCIQQNFGGLENLSLIPGNVGTCPIQNIGAYGIEVKDTITKVEALEIENCKKLSFSNEDCNFGYRNSIFKNELKGKVAITSVGFRLTTKKHQLKTSYGAIEAALQNKNILQPSIKDVSDAVISIRKAKLPNPEEIGNSGSFFKNPVISKSAFEVLQKDYPKVPFYEVKSFESYKIPAGWLIEQAGFKGKRFGDAGVHKNQALVLVNYGNADGKEIYALAKKIQQKILKQFSISLEIEVNVI